MKEQPREKMKFKCYGTIGKETPFGAFEKCSKEFWVEGEDIKVFPPKCPHCGSENTRRI
jgi:predicted Zn-ribbon and HTH transcriptional regulator